MIKTSLNRLDLVKTSKDLFGVSARGGDDFHSCAVVADDDDDEKTQKVLHHHQMTRNTDASLLAVPWSIATVGVRVMCR
jgi:hypothetical protein